MTTATYSEILDMYPATSPARCLSAAKRDGWQINKAADPVEAARNDLPVEAALEVIDGDAGLLTFTR